jgi:hypothetical protein
MAEASKGQASGPGQASSSVALLSEHLTYVAALALVLFALAKTYAVANFSLTTAGALLTTAPLAVLLGTLTSYDYFFFPILALASGCVGALVWRREGFNGVAAGAGAVAVIAVLLSPVRDLVWVAGTFVAFLTVHKFAVRSSRAEEDDARPRDGVRGWPRRARRGVVSLLFSLRATVTVFFVGLVGAVVLLTISNPWLPAEVMQVDEGSQSYAVVGFVVGTDPRWTTTMRADDRGLSRVLTDDIAVRRLCHLSGAQPSGRRPLLWVLTGRAYRSPNISCEHAFEQLSTDELACGSLPGEASVPGSERFCTLPAREEVK